MIRTIVIIAAAIVSLQTRADTGSELEDLKTLNDLDNSHLDFDFFSETNDNSWNESKEALEILESFEKRHREDDYEQEADQQDAIEEELEEEIEIEPEEILADDEFDDDIEEPEEPEEPDEEEEVEEPEDNE